jgi:hypothetical protein
VLSTASDVSLTLRGILSSIQFNRSRWLGLLSGVKQPAEKRHAPAAARTRTAAFADFTGNPRLMQANPVDNLALRHVETVAQFVVRLHICDPHPLAG